MAGTESAGIGLLATEECPRGGQMADEYPEVMTAEQVAEFLHWSLNHTQRALKAGMIPGRKIGGEWRVSKRQLLNFIEHGGNPPGDSTAL